MNPRSILKLHILLHIADDKWVALSCCLLEFKFQIGPVHFGIGWRVSERLPEITKDYQTLPKFEISGKVICQKPLNSVEQERTERTEAQGNNEWRRGRAEPRKTPNTRKKQTAATPMRLEVGSNGWENSFVSGRTIKLYQNFTFSLPKNVFPRPCSEANCSLKMCCDFNDILPGAIR